MTALDIPAIRATYPLSAIVGQSLPLKRSGGEWQACCPFHQERTPSFTINDAKGFYHCFGCGAHGDVLDWLQQTRQIGLREAAEQLGVSPPPLQIRQTTPARPERDTTGEAREIWRNAGPAKGTQAETYLCWRGIVIPIPETIRFARLRYGSGGEPLPCLVALITGCDGRFAGVQRTYLRSDGKGKADVPKPKLSLGRVAGGAIRLAPASAELIVCEGLEDALTLQQELGRTTWAAAGASMLPRMLLPSMVQTVVVGADGDQAGEAAAKAAAEHFAADGRTVKIIRPSPPYKDFNDELTGGGR